MRVACLVSGGKDSVYATYLAQQKGWDVTHLIGLVSDNPDSWMFQKTPEEHFKALSRAMNIPIVVHRTSGEPEKELNDLRVALGKAHGIDGVVSGAVLSDYQKHRIDMVCEEMNLRSFAPLWRKDGEMLLGDMLHAGFQAEIVKVAAEGLDSKLLGKTIDEHVFGRLKELHKRYGIHVMFEGGEAETLVTDCPMFRKRIDIIESEKIWDSRSNSGILSIKKSELTPK